jgi:[ribosomal protein S18]-alanine N-acetyltransferase
VTARVEISRSGIDAVERIMPVMRDAFDPQFGEVWTMGQCIGMLSLPGTALFIAELDDDICGFVVARCVVDEVELLLIAVDPNAQRKRIGNSLVSKTVDWAKDMGANRVFLEVRKGNPAIDFYNRGGFVQIGLRKSYYRGNDGHAHDAITLVKIL